MKIKGLVILFLILGMFFTPLCSADVGDVIIASARVAEGLLWVPAIVLMVTAVGPLVLLNQFEEIVNKEMKKVFHKPKETKNAS